MSNSKTGLDRAVDYAAKLSAFQAAFQTANRTRNGVKTDVVEIETGRKFDKVYVNTGVQKLGRYMVDRHSWTIYGIKSWAQVNTRRIYGTLDTIDQFDWSPHYAEPLPGTQAEKDLQAREVAIKSSYRQRGRPRKAV